MRNITLALLAASLLGVSAYVLAGYHFVLPIDAAFRVVFIATPVAFGLERLGTALMSKCARRIPSGVVATSVGCLVLVVWRPGGLIGPIVLALLALLLIRLLTGPAVERRNVSTSVAALTLWMIAIHHFNYVLLSFVGHRLNDPLLMNSDLMLYGAVWPDVTYSRLFPIVKGGPLLTFLENAYLSLAVQPMLVPLVFRHHEATLKWFFKSACSCYVVGGVIFILFPAIGPTLYFPGSFDPAFSDTVTGQTVEAMLADANSIRHGGQPVNGFGYFIAFPSMHAALASVCQYVLWRSRIHFWLMLPINVMLLLSTALLGQHYIVDTVAGIFVALLLAWTFDRRGSVAARPCGREQVESEQVERVTLPA
jgi:membrane-associated phospholipid phosphatase